MNTLEKELVSVLQGGTDHEAENKKLLAIIEALKLENESLKKKATKKERIPKYLIDININNINNYLKTEEYQKRLVNPQIFQYDEGLTAFDKNISKYYKYQKEFIENWSVSSQELVILYYGVGTGKSLISITCAEQFINLNNNSYVYFLLPASLVLDMINKMFQYGINPLRKNSKGEYLYNFVSYQQLMNSHLDFKDNSLLIIDEVHNLRNFRSVEINEKVSARKWVATDSYSLVGTKLGIMLLQAKTKFLRCIFMSGTLFVNSVYDIEPIISIGYKKAPMNNFEIDTLERINRTPSEMAVYYNGLISYYQKPSDAQNFPSTKYHMVAIQVDNDIEKDEYDDDPFYVNTRNDLNKEKIGWVVSFLHKHKNEKTLIYAQFINRAIKLLGRYLTKKKYKFGIISGELTASQKQQVQDDYNTGKINILIFSLAIKEGISFKETNNFIYMQPYWNYAITEQILARGLRADSHKNGIKSTVDIYLLCSVDDDGENAKILMHYIEWIFNNNIKNYIPKVIKSTEVKVKVRGGESTKLVQTTELSNLVQKAGETTDIKLYSFMLNKQGGINKFEKVLLNDVPSFEKSNNIESNKFIESFNAKIIVYEKKHNRILKLNEKIILKKKLYRKFYDKQILKTNSRILRIDQDDKLKQVRNPDLEDNLNNPDYPDSNIQSIKKMLDSGYSLVDILDSFKLSKTDITNFQANFTPDTQVEILINQSGIKTDTRPKIVILEPTSGIGNIISHVLKCPNVQNMMIDSVEIHKLFYQIQKARFGSINNINMYNIDLLKYRQKYGYDYILGNPPFNIRTTEEVKIRGVIKKKDLHIYDVHFVAMCYNMLNLGGKLTMIISNRFQTGLYLYFKVFDTYLQILRKDNPDNVKIEPIGNFKTSSTVSKGMETNFGMVCITLKKIGNLLIDLNKEPSVDDEQRLKNLGLAILKKEAAQLKREAKKAEKTKITPKKSVKGSALQVKTLKRLIDNSYQRKDKNGKLKQKENDIDGYKLDNNLTNDTSAVYYNKDKNHVVHSVRGTNGTLKDWSNNAIYMASPELYKKTDRYLNAKEIQKKIDDRYTTAKKTMTTHSQSGIIGRHLGVANPNLEVISLNPATYNKDNNINNPNEYTVKSTKDLVSLYHKNKPRDTIIKGESLDQYKEHDIGLLDRLNPNLLIGNGAYYFK